MPAKNFLKPAQKENLLKALKEEEHPDIRERILILLLLNDGKTQEEIADFLGCSLKKISYWCIHADPENLESLKDERMKGNYTKATEEYIKLLLEVIDKEPSEFGYQFGRWTAERLSIYLEKKTGISLSSSQVRRILAKKKYVYIWAKYSLEDKCNPEKRKLFKRKLSEYLTIAKQNPERLQVWFWDESGFSLRVIRRKNWCKKGKRKKVSGHRSKGRINVMGGLRATDKKRFIEFIKKGNSASFYEVLKVFYEEIKNEWLEKDKELADK